MNCRRLRQFGWGIKHQDSGVLRTYHKILGSKHFKHLRKRGES